MEEAGKEWKEFKDKGKIPTLTQLRRTHKFPGYKKKIAANKPKITTKKHVEAKQTPVHKRNSYKYQMIPVADAVSTAAAKPAHISTNYSEAILEYPKTIFTTSFLKENVLPFASGIVGSKILAGQCAKLILGADKNPERYEKYFASAGWKKAVWEVFSGVFGGTAIGVLSKGKYSDFALKFAAGGILTALLTLLETTESLGPVRKMAPGFYGIEDEVDEIGNDIEDDLTDKIANEIAMDLRDYAVESEVKNAPERETDYPSESLRGYFTEKDSPKNQQRVTMLSDFLADGL